ncbi:uncharacterized protein [Euwallacea fornicatus]|uniref:uncharacterized protein isoform X2 n=1 Tax=Euwallacea fornicatus TaxID=995702 RepID=UPI00338E440B
MFKSIVFILAALAVSQGQLYLGSVESQNPSISNTRLKYIKNAVNNITRSMIKTTCSGYLNRLENAIMALYECSESIDMENETICSAFNGNFEKCTQPTVQVFEECLPKKSRKIPSMVVRMGLKSMKYICKTNGEHLLELKNRCFTTPTIQLIKCMKKFETTKEKYMGSNSYISAKEVCELLEKLKPCLISHLQISCRHPTTREAFIDFVEEGVLSICKNIVTKEIELDESQIS